jgi:GTPase SAR1 family protein
MLNYIDLKEKVVSQLLRLQELIGGENYTKSGTSLEEIIKKLKEDQVNLVVLGHFNRGKSTFINSLLGEKLLPTSIIPLTSVITLIKYGETLKTRVYFKNKTSQDITVEEIANYATESGNPNNKKNVARIEIAFPGAYLKGGVTIVDTPGFSSVYLTNTLITQNYLPQADVAMFLISADPPISQVEFEFLKEIKAFTDKIFILQNKIDQVDEAEKLQSLEFSKRIIETYLGIQNLKIYPISAKLALEGEINNDPEKVTASLLPEFEKALAEFLLREKGVFTLLVAIHQGLKLLEEVKVAMEMEKTVYRTSHVDLETNVKTFLSHLEGIQQEQKDLRDQIQGKVDRLLKDLKPEPSALEQREFVKNAYQAYYEAHQNEDRKTLVQALETCFKQSAREALKVSLTPKMEKIRKEFEEGAVRFAHRIQELSNRVRQLSTELFNIQVEVPQLMESRRSETKTFPTNQQASKTKTEGLSLFKISTFSLLLPQKYFQGLVWQEMLKNLEGELERTSEQLRQELAEKIQRSAKKLTDIMDQQITTTVENVQNALNRDLEVKVKGKKKIEQAIKTIDDRLFQIQIIKKTLSDLQKVIV